MNAEEQRIRDLIERSSLGTPEAKALRASVSAEQVRPILDAGKVMEILRDTYTSEGCWIWLRARNRRLDGEVPWELIKQGRTDEVLVEAHRIEGVPEPTQRAAAYNDDPPWDQRPQTEHESSGQQIDRLAAFIMDEVPSKPSRSEGAVDTAIRIIRGYLNAPEVEWPWPADRQPSGAVEDPANPWNRGFNEGLRQCRDAYHRAVRQPRTARIVGGAE